MTDTSATWNDERVEQLKKLWAEGKSASQIAAEIGGISRNAVIGKVHRLGLAGRPKAGAAATAATGGRSRSANAETKSANASGGGADSTAPPQSGPSMAEAGAEPARRETGGGAATPVNAEGARVAATAAAGIDRASSDTADGALAMTDKAQRGGSVTALPECEQRVTIMELREGMCRWPIGDPTSPEFRFCGARADIGSPYCTQHARIAYQPAADRRRERKAASG